MKTDRTIIYINGMMGAGRASQTFQWFEANVDAKKHVLDPGRTIDVTEMRQALAKLLAKDNPLIVANSYGCFLASFFPEAEAIWINPCLYPTEILPSQYYVALKMPFLTIGQVRTRFGQFLPPHLLRTIQGFDEALGPDFKTADIISKWERQQKERDMLYTNGKKSSAHIISSTHDGLVKDHHCAQFSDRPAIQVQGGDHRLSGHERDLYLKPLLHTLNINYLQR